MFFKVRRRFAAVGVALSVVLVSLVGAISMASASTAMPWVSSVSPTTGRVAGGARITVNGSHFSHVRAVLFGTTPGTSVRVLSNTRLQVTAPAHSADIVHVRVRTSVGTSPTHATDRYTFVAPPRITSVTPNSGSTVGGVRLTIHGSNFLRVSNVLFGNGLGTSIRVSSSSSLQVTAPAHTAGVVSIRIQAAYGSSPSITADEFTYVAPPAIFSLSPSQGSTIGGTHVTIYGSGFSAANHVTFGSTPATSFTLESSTQIEATAPAESAGSVDVHVTTPYGMSSAGAGDHYTYVAPPPAQSWQWQDPKHGPAVSGQPTSISCPSPTFCVAVDIQGAVITYNGSSWSTPDPVDTAAAPWALTSVSCPTTTFCLAADNNGSYVTYDGSSWSAPTNVEVQYTTLRVSCTSSTFCMAGALGNTYVRTFNGTSWSARIQAPSDIQSVSCATPTKCLVGDSKGNVYTYDGTSWSAPTTVHTGQAGFNLVTAISCASATFCMAVDGGATGIYNGATWTVLSSAQAGAAPPLISCVSSQFCMGMEGVSTPAEFNGTSWTTGPATDGGDSIDAISCASVTSCVAIDSYGGASTFTASGWSDEYHVQIMDPNVGSLDSVACSSATFCMATQNYGGQTIYNGATWSAETWGEGRSGLACTSSTYCVADSASGMSAYDGTRWTAMDMSTWSPTYGQPTSGPASCYVYNSRPQCLEVDAANNVVFIDGGTVGQAIGKMPTSPDRWWMTSCPDVTFCAFVGSLGDFVTMTASGMSSVSTIDDFRALNSVSCTSSTFCVAVDVAGNALTYNGTSWSAPASIDPAGDLVSVSCSSTVACAAVDNGGNALNFDGTSWSLPVRLFDGRMTSVSCPTGTTMCAAVGVDEGYEATVLTTHP